MDEAEKETIRRQKAEKDMVEAKRKVNFLPIYSRLSFGHLVQYHVSNPFQDFISDKIIVNKNQLAKGRFLLDTEQNVRHTAHILLDQHML